MWLVETFYNKKTKNSNSYTEFGLAITWVFEYVPDSGSYYKSYILTMHRDSALDCYELQVAAVAQLPRSAAALLFPLVAPCCTPHFSIDAMQESAALIAISVDYTDSACKCIASRSVASSATCTSNQQPSFWSL